MGRPTKKLAKYDSKDDVTVSEPEKINLSDQQAIKNKLDCAVADVVLSCGYEEDFLISNVKLVLGLLAISFALYAQFGPGKFPSNWWTVFYCVVCYIFVTLILNVFCWVKEGDAFLITHKKPGFEFGARVSSRLERYSDIYTLCMSSADKLQRGEAKMEVSITGYFHSDGYLAEAKFKKDVEELLQSYERLESKGGEAGYDSKKYR